jgi:hypothetical protein
MEIAFVALLSVAFAGSAVVVLIALDGPRNGSGESAFLAWWRHASQSSSALRMAGSAVRSLNHGVNWTLGIEAPPLEDGEEHVLDEVGRLTTSRFWGQNGRLLLTNRRLLFKVMQVRLLSFWPFRRAWTEIRFEWLESVHRAARTEWPWSVFATCYVLQLMNGRRYYLEIYRGAKWRDALRRIDGLPSGLASLVESSVS